jgi:hypothetical protein
MLCAWNLRNHSMIERHVPEFGNEEIAHNVAFSLHAMQHLTATAKPLISAKLLRAEAELRVARQIPGQPAAGFEKG